MTTRKVTFNVSVDVVPCPKCGNKTEFSIHSERASEDCYDVWAQCQCGHEPSSGDAFEDVNGGCHDENVMMAIYCWNSAMESAAA